MMGLAEATCSTWGRPRFPVGFTWASLHCTMFHLAWQEASIDERISCVQSREPAATTASHREGTRWPGSRAGVRHVLHSSTHRRLHVLSFEKCLVGEPGDRRADNRRYPE
jgi:hypothetical protein